MPFEKFDKIEEPSVPPEKKEEKMEEVIEEESGDFELEKEEREESRNSKEQVEERTGEKFKERPMSKTEKEREEEIGEEAKKEGLESTKIEDKEKDEESPKEASLEKEERGKEKTKKEKPPQFIKEFSKQESPEERSKLTQEILQKRAESAEKKKEMFEREKELQEKLSEIQGLEQTIAGLSDNGVSRLMNYFKLRALREQLAGEKGAYEEKQKEEIVPPDMKEPKRMLDNFYAEQKKKLENSPYTKEDITKYFSEEHLASLSLEDYVLLMRRFPSEMVAHVTRQGVRDHTGMVYHTAGEGNYHDGFMKIVEDGRLRSPLGVVLIEGEKEEVVQKYLKLDSFKDREEGIAYLNNKINLGAQGQAEAGSYADARAIHFATEEVADAYYGSEKGNEVFIAFPSAQIASQYHFSGQLTESGGGYWNDQWVWENEQKGIDINSGIIFIPEEARVNPKTGSRYELDEKGMPAVMQENADKAFEVLNSDKIHQDIDDMLKILGGMKSGVNVEDTWNQRSNRDIISRIEPYRQILENDFQIKDERLQKTILDYHLLFSAKVAKQYSQEDFKEKIVLDIQSALKDSGIYYKEVQNAISSKDFWEKYFSEHEGKRPSKIVYYKEGNPTDALWDWKKKNGLIKRATDEELGFAERKIERSAPVATAGMSRFKSIAEKVINDYFGSKTEASI